jgi:hypothetical protein
MWLATEYGFYSFVHRAPDRYYIRARTRGELENLLSATAFEREIYHLPEDRYPFSLIVSREDFARIMAGLALALDDPVLRKRVPDSGEPEDRTESFRRIWELLSDLERRQAVQDHP